MKLTFNLGMYMRDIRLDEKLNWNFCIYQEEHTNPIFRIVI